MQLFSNNAKTTLASSILSTDTTITVATAKGSLFNTINTIDHEIVTLSDVSGTLTEIVKVTARSGDVFTVVRGQEGTTALGWSSGTLFEGRLTKGSLVSLPTKDSQGNTVLGSLTYSTTPTNPIKTSLIVGSCTATPQVSPSFGNSNIIIGPNTSLSGTLCDNSVGIGSNVNISGTSAISIGYAASSPSNSVSIGYIATASSTATYSTTIGNLASSNESYCVVIGSDSSGYNSISDAGPCNVFGAARSNIVPCSVSIPGVGNLNDVLGSTSVTISTNNFFYGRTGMASKISTGSVSSTVYNTTNGNIITAINMATDYSQAVFVCEYMTFHIMTGTVTSAPTITLACTAGSVAFSPTNTSANTMSSSPLLPTVISNGTGTLTLRSTTPSTGTFTAKVILTGYFIQKT